MRGPLRHRPLIWAAVIACAPLVHAQSNAPAITLLPPVEVVGTTPQPGAGTPADQIPSNVQTADGDRLRRLQSLNLPDFMAAQLPSVNVNDAQGNPFQINVNFRGFTASPLLGVAQGLSIYLDGVRINEAFGDVVNWDMIPTNALAHVTLLPGSNPLFGLNTLGGALSLQTRSGDTDPGGEIEVQGGSFGRIRSDLSHGQRLGAHGHLFVALSRFDEDGWRDFSPSRVRQIFVKGGERTVDYSWDLGLLHADSRLVGNGLLPESMLAVDRRQIYTAPDQTDNHVTMLTLHATRAFVGGLELSGTTYVRRVRAATVNGDLNADAMSPDSPRSGLEHRTGTRSQGEGLALQLVKSLGPHRLTAGLSDDRARNRFEQSDAAGELDASRRVHVTDATAVDALISGTSHSTGVFASGLVMLATDLQWTLSGRYNHTRVQTIDEGRAALGLATSLDGRGRYGKFNPASGLAWQITPALTAFGGFSQGNRAPSPIELGCSDPAHACILPNALQSDPPLRQVIARTLETGLRGHLGGGLRWSAAAYRTINQDDLLFISNGHASGYFSNVGKTLRQGLELGVSQETARSDWSVSYSRLQAEFRNPACLLSRSNSSAQSGADCHGDGEIEVSPGARLPNLPRHILKARLDARPLPTWRVGAQFTAYSSQLVRGNENSAQVPDGVDFFGSGKVAGFAVVDLTTNVTLGGGWELFAKVANLANRQYANGGQLAVDAFDANGSPMPPARWRNEQFVAPGAPRALWVGMRRRFGAGS